MGQFSQKGGDVVLTLVPSHACVAQVVYQLCGLWFKLSADLNVNGALLLATCSVPF
jgi:hypothetical protein